MDNWWTADDIIEELKQHGVYITLQMLGRIANKENLVKEENYGKLYDKELINVILTKYKEKIKMKNKKNQKEGLT